MTVENCVFQGTDRPIRIKSRRRRGGRIERLSFQNLIMDRAVCPFAINMFYSGGVNGNAPCVQDRSFYRVDEGTPKIRDIRISNVMACHVSSAAAFFYGLPESRIENVSLRHCSVCLDGDGQKRKPAMIAGLEPMSQKGAYLRNVSDLRFYDVKISGWEGSPVDADDTADFRWMEEGGAGCRTLPDTKEEEDHAEKII